jgi:hypothetical protein
LEAVAGLNGIKGFGNDDGKVVEVQDSNDRSSAKEWTLGGTVRRSHRRKNILSYLMDQVYGNKYICLLSHNNSYWIKQLAMITEPLEDPPSAKALLL